MAGRSTEVLLIRSGRGDTAAFAELYDLLAPRVFGTVTRLVHDPGTAERVACEAFLETWRRAGSYYPARSGAADWVLAIARRAALLAAGLTPAQAGAVQLSLVAEPGRGAAGTALLTGALRTLASAAGR